MGAALRLPRAGYREMRWRNGAGTTLEVAREPAGGDEFDWRLSIATVAASGPFSVYAGYQRMVALASGAGFVLTVGGAAPARLASPGEHLLFPGDAATACELIAGAASDVSLMVRRPGAILAVERIELGSAPRVLALGAPRAALVCLAGGVGCEPDTGAALTLEALDTLLCDPGIGACRIRAAGDTALALLLRWRPAAETTKIA